MVVYDDFDMEIPAERGKRDSEPGPPDNGPSSLTFVLSGYQVTFPDGRVMVPAAREWSRISLDVKRQLQTGAS